MRRREHRQPRNHTAPRTWLTLLLAAAVATAVSGCGTAEHGDGKAAPNQVARSLAMLPNLPELRRHVLIADLSRLREAYPEADAFRRALLGVELPDALSGAGSHLWSARFGLAISDMSSFGSAGFHPAETAVASGRFSRPAIGGRLRGAGYAKRGREFMRGADGSIDPATVEGRLSLSALNRLIVTPTRVIAASSTALVRAAASPSATLADEHSFAAAAAAISPITSAAFFDTRLIRPPSGVPVSVIAQYSARLVAIGIDDRGANQRVVKIVLVYDDAGQAAADAALIGQHLPASPLVGTQGKRFSDLSSEWNVTASGTSVMLEGRLATGADPSIWRSMAERGDLAILVRPSLP
jgi:hypothetical protein